MHLHVQPPTCTLPISVSNSDLFPPGISIYLSTRPPAHPSTYFHPKSIYLTTHHTLTYLPQSPCSPTSPDPHPSLLHTLLSGHSGQALCPLGYRSIPTLPLPAPVICPHGPASTHPPRPCNAHSSFMDPHGHIHPHTCVRTCSRSRSQNMYVPITAMGTHACARSQGLALPPSPTHYRAPPSPWLLSRENPLCPPHARQPGGASPGPPSAPGRSSPCSWPISRGTPHIVAETSSPGASALRGHLPSPHLVTKPSSDWGPTSQSPGPILGAAPEATTTPDPATSPWTSSPVFPGQPEVTQLQEECQATCSTQGAPQIALPQAPSRAFFPELPAPASLEATPPLGLSPCRIDLRAADCRASVPGDSWAPISPGTAG